MFLARKLGQAGGARGLAGGKTGEEMVDSIRIGEQHGLSGCSYRTKPDNEEESW